MAKLLIITLFVLTGCTSQLAANRLDAEAKTYRAPQVSGEVIAMAGLEPVVGAKVSHGNFPSVAVSSGLDGGFSLPAASSQEVKLLLPAAGRQYQPVLVNMPGYDSRTVWLPVFLADRDGVQPVAQAGFVLLDQNPEVIVDSIDDFALPYAAIERPLQGCDADAWQFALTQTNTARKLASKLDLSLSGNSLMSSRQQLMLTDSYQHVETVWQLVWSSCRFSDDDESLRARKVFDYLQREAQSMRDALMLVDAF